MIDENKEQLRNLFRKYNVVDVQPAVTDKLPDDITTLQVPEPGPLKAGRLLFRGCFSCERLFFSCISAAGHHHSGRAAVLGWNLLCHHELALPQSVRTRRISKFLCVSGAGGAGSSISVLASC